MPEPRTETVCGERGDDIACEGMDICLERAERLGHEADQHITPKP